MKAEYTNYNDAPVQINIEESNGGIMITVNYSEEYLQPETPLIEEHSWTDETRNMHVSVNHLGLKGFEYDPNGNDMITLRGETLMEIELIKNGRCFYCHNQLLILPE